MFQSRVVVAARDRDWMIPVTAILILELLLWSALYGIGRAYPPMITAYSSLFFVALVLAASFKILSELRELPLRPILHLAHKVRENLPVFISGIVGIQLFMIGSSSFSALKAAMPKTVPFWLDEPLANAEHALFGVHPWEISHALLGWATPAIEYLYCTFFPAQIIAAIMLLFSRPSAFKSQALVSLFLIWFIIGVGGAYAFSSAGPIFYDRLFGGDTFSRLDLSGAPITTELGNILWLAHAADVPVMANGISAMPSMHVALTFWFAMLFHRTRFAPLAWTYFALVWLASVHLGWHYVADGLIGAAGALMAWKLSPLVITKTQSVWNLHAASFPKKAVSEGANPRA